MWKRLECAIFIDARFTRENLVLDLLLKRFSNWVWVCWGKILRILLCLLCVFFRQMMWGYDKSEAWTHNFRIDFKRYLLIFSGKYLLTTDCVLFLRLLSFFGAQKWVKVTDFQRWNSGSTRFSDSLSGTNHNKNKLVLSAFFIRNKSHCFSTNSWFRPMTNGTRSWSSRSWKPVDQLDVIQATTKQTVRILRNQSVRNPDFFGYIHWVRFCAKLGGKCELWKEQIDGCH